MYEDEREEIRWINEEQVQLLNRLALLGFSRFAINPTYGTIIAQIDFNFGGIEVEVSYAERADLRVTVGDNNCIWRDELTSVFKIKTSIETFAQKALGEWMKAEFGGK